MTVKDGFEERYHKLNSADRENFQRIVNWLLAHTFMYQSEYKGDDMLRSTKQDYLFVERNFRLFNDYLEFSGFRLDKDNNYGVISLVSSFEYNRIRFDKLTTLMLYGLRLIYDEKREELSLAKDVFTTTGELVHKLLTLRALRKRPAQVNLHNALAKLHRFQIVDKQTGAWENAETRLIILPTVLFIVSNERINNMYNLIDDNDAENDGDLMEDEE